MFAILTTIMCSLLAMVQMSFDVWNSSVPCLTFFSTHSINVTDPASTFEPIYSPVTLTEALTSFGSIMFGFGGTVALLFSYTTLD